MIILRKFTTRAFGIAAASLLGAASLLASAAVAQVPADIQDFHSHGVHVILRSTTANQVIGVFLGIEGGLAYGETQNASLGRATASVMAESGSDKFPKDEYRDTLAKLSTSIGGSGDFFGMSFSLRTVVPSFNAAWGVFSDLIMHPHWDPIEAERQRQVGINAINSRESDPESYTNMLMDSIWLGKAPINRKPSVAELEGMTLADLQNYYHAQLQRSRMILTIVGNVSRADIEQKLAEFEAIPQGSFILKKMSKFEIPTGTAAMPLTRELPTTYVLMRYDAPPVGSSDWAAMRVLSQILDKRLFEEVRTKRNLSYAPGGWVTGSHNNYYGTISLQSVLPDSAASVVFDVVKKLHDQLIPAQELQEAKEARMTTYYYTLQTNLAQAKALYFNQVEALDWKNLFTVGAETKKVTAADVQRVAKRYMHNFQFVLLGPSGKYDTQRFSWK